MNICNHIYISNIVYNMYKLTGSENYYYKLRTTSFLLSRRSLMHKITNTLMYTYTMYYMHMYVPTYMYYVLSSIILSVQSFHYGEIICKNEWRQSFWHANMGVSQKTPSLLVEQNTWTIILELFLCSTTKTPSLIC